MPGTLESFHEYSHASVNVYESVLAENVPSQGTPLLFYARVPQFSNQCYNISPFSRIGIPYF